MDRRAFLKACAAGMGGAALLSSGAKLGFGQMPAVVAGAKRQEPYLLGADISWTLEDEAAGATYWDRGVQKDLLQILKDYNFNAIRARLFVNPSAQGGYSRRGSFCDLEHTKILAKRVKEKGFKFLLDFHYADTWTSPGHQSKPAAWAGYNVDQLRQAVYDWTKTALTELKAQGTLPEYVQVGNETTSGMLEPEGRNVDNFAAFVNAGATAAREMDKSIKVAIHSHLGRDNAAIRKWVDNFLQRKTDFDIIGMSCYAEAQPGNFKNNFDDLAVRYPQLSFMSLEYSRNKTYLNDLIYNAPNNKGLGSFIWEPTRWREAIFDHNGVNAGDDDNNKPHTEAKTLPPLPGVVMPPEPATPPPVSRPATGPATRRGFGGGFRSRGGRYHTNEYILEYPKMAKAYGLI